MPDILILQNSRFEGPAFLGQLLEEDGFKTQIIHAKTEKIPTFNHSALIILGAVESANDNLTYLKEEMKLIRHAVNKEIPVLGVCLGSQLIANSFGARVYKSKIKEIGIYHDIHFDNTSKSALFSGIKSPATVFHWHSETFELPENAVRLAHSKNYKNQAFQLGSAIGVQFHMEVDEETIRLWLEKSKEELDKIPYISAEAIIKKIPDNIKTIQNNMKIFYQNFKTAFAL